MLPQWNCNVNETTFQSGLRFQTSLSLLRVSCKRALTKLIDIFWTFHCVKRVQIQSFFWSVFSHIRTEYGDLVQSSSNTGEYGPEKNTVFGHFSHSVYFQKKGMKILQEISKEE